MLSHQSVFAHSYFVNQFQSCFPSYLRVAKKLMKGPFMYTMLSLSTVFVSSCRNVHKLTLGPTQSGGRLTSLRSKDMRIMYFTKDTVRYRIAKVELN